MEREMLDLLQPIRARSDTLIDTSELNRRINFGPR